MCTTENEREKLLLYIQIFKLTVCLLITETVLEIELKSLCHIIMVSSVWLVLQ